MLLIHVGDTDISINKFINYYAQKIILIIYIVD